MTEGALNSYLPLPMLRFESLSSDSLVVSGMVKMK